MTDWGLPDWRDENSYGEFGKWSNHRWRWEFLRRRDDLRSAFDRHAENWYRTNSALNHRIGDTTPILKPDEPGFLVVCSESEAFGYAGLPNPRISQQPESVLVYLASSGIEYYLGEHYEASGPLEGKRKFAVIFDLDRPINSQIAEVKTILEKGQKAIHGKLISPRRHPKKWFTYLRVLDAREDGASWSEIADLLTVTAGTPQAARDTWEQANELRFKI